MLNQFRLQSIIDDGFQRANGLRAKLAQLKSYDYASDAPKDFIRLLEDALQRIVADIHAVCTVVGECPTDELCQTLIAFVQGRTQWLSCLYPYLEYVERARAGRNLPSLVMALERLGKNILPSAAKTAFLVSPIPALNYFYVPFTSIARERVPVFSSEPAIVILGFPEAARDELLCHSALGHELGHFLSAELGILGQFKNLIDAPKFEGAKVAEVIRHFNEYVADTVAAYLFGPAMVFTQAQLAEIRLAGLYIASETHPAPCSRIHHLCHLLEAFGYWEPFKNNLTPCAKRSFQILDAWRQLAAHEHGDEEDEDARTNTPAPQREEYDFLQPALTKVQELVEGQLPSALRLDLDKVFALVEKRIVLGVPPSVWPHSDTPTDMASILNAGWVYRTAYLREDSLTSKTLDKPNRVSDLQGLSRLINKAIEHSEVLHRRPTTTGEDQ